MSLESLPQPIALARAANRHRHQLHPEDPKIINFTLSHEHLPNGFLHRNILADDCRHLIFATGHMLDLLARVKCWYLDATIKVVKQSFVQLYSIHAFIRHGPACKQILLVFVLISRRRTTDHNLVLNQVCDILPNIPVVTRMVMNFEQALWVSIPSIFPEVCLKGCVFHWVQAVWRKIQETGLVLAYR